MTTPTLRHRARPLTLVLVALGSVSFAAIETWTEGHPRAQTPPPAAGPTSNAGKPAAADVAPAGVGGSPGAGLPATVGAWGGRIGLGEVAIVGGNVASARERALADALKQAVDLSIAALVPDARTAQPKIVGQVLGRARGYIRRYRTLDEGERGRGIYGVRVEADVDEVALQRAFDKGATGNPATATPSAAPSAPSYLLVAAGVPEAAAVAGRAFVAAGARVQQGPPDLTDPTKAVDAAVRAGLGAVAFVSGNVTQEGKVRGPGLESVSCGIEIRVLAAGSGVSVANESETQRTFGDKADAARADCLVRVATAAVGRVVPAPTARPVSDMRTIVVDADVVEPGAVPAFVKHLRGIGSVSAIEVRRINPGHVEVWVRSRLVGTALAAALGRDGGGPVVVTAVEISGDLVRVRARMREPAPPSAAPGPAAVPSSGPQNAPATPPAPASAPAPTSAPPPA